MNSEVKTVFEKNNIIIKKQGINKYFLFFSLENQNIYIPQIINLSIIDAFCFLNKDIIHDYKLTIHDELNGNVFILFKHFFPDFGLQQLYIYLNISIQKNDKTLKIISQQISDNIPNNLPANAELLLLDDINIDCVIENQHKLHFSNSLIMNNTKIEIPDFFEKFGLNILSKIIIRIKQFIEKYKL
jgi:hypothetical protein